MQGKNPLDSGRAIDTLRIVFLVVNHGTVTRSRTATQDSGARKITPPHPLLGYENRPHFWAFAHCQRIAAPDVVPGEVPGWRSGDGGCGPFKSRQFRHGQRGRFFLGGSMARGCVPRAVAGPSHGWGRGASAAGV